MAISPNTASALTGEVTRIYTRAEMAVVQRVVSKLKMGIDTPDWEKTQLANTAALRRELTAALAQLDAKSAAEINAAVGTAYALGEKSGLTDVRAYAEKLSAVASPARRAAVELVAREVVGVTLSTHPLILRKAMDVHQQVVGRAVAATLTGTIDRKPAAQQALNQLLGRGITLAPAGRNGRQLTLPDYVSMAVRTGTAKAAVEGHLDALAQNDLDLVMVDPGPRDCDICDAWAGRVLFARSGVEGDYEFEDARTGESTTVTVEGSLDDARLDGWGHPNCRCTVSAYIPGVTSSRPREDWDQQGYEAQQQQRGIERKIREWKTREALALDEQAAAKAAAKVSDWQAAQRTHLNQNPALKRQYDREQAGRTH